MSANILVILILSVLEKEIESANITAKDKSIVNLCGILRPEKPELSTAIVHTHLHQPHPRKPLNLI